MNDTNNHNTRENRQFSYTITEKVGILSQYGSISKELNLISYGGDMPLYDLRKWQTLADGTRKLCKGITFSENEAKKLKAMLNARTEI